MPYPIGILPPEKKNTNVRQLVDTVKNKNEQAGRNTYIGEWHDLSAIKKPDNTDKPDERPVSNAFTREKKEKPENLPPDNLFG